jgi:hypothetical protein
MKIILYIGRNNAIFIIDIALLMGFTCVEFGFGGSLIVIERIELFPEIIQCVFFAPSCAELMTQFLIVLNIKDVAIVD